MSFMDLVNIKILSRVTCWLKLLVSLSGPKVGKIISFFRLLMIRDLWLFLFSSVSLSLCFGGDMHQHSQCLSFLSVLCTLNTFKSIFVSMVSFLFFPNCFAREKKNLMELIFIRTYFTEQCCRYFCE